MKEQIAIHCNTEELLEKVKAMLLLEGHEVRSNPEKGESNGNWKMHKESTCVSILDNMLVKHTKQWAERQGYTIITAAEYLGGKDVKEFEVGDRVECIDASNRHELTKGATYTVRELYAMGSRIGFNVEGIAGGLCPSRFKLAGSATKPKTTKENNADYLEKNLEAVCVVCRAYFEDMPSHCEGSRCEEAGELYLEENPNIKENNMNTNISNVFDKTKEALLVEKHLGNQIGTSFIDGLVLADKKEDVLKEAKRLEKESKE